MSFAGEGTPGMGLSAMFWNPAAVTQTKGWGAEAHVSFTFPNSAITTNTGLTSPSIETNNQCGSATTTCDQTDNILNDRTIPAFYGAYRINPDWYLGLSVTHPFDFSSSVPFTGNTIAGAGFGSVPDASADMQLGTGLKFDTIDVSPIVGWRLNDMVSVGIGPQFVWLRGTYGSNLFQIPEAVAGGNGGGPFTISTQGFGAGLTAGLTFTPTRATEIALGYRSQVRLGLSGPISFPASAILLASPVTAPFSGLTANVTGDMTLPDQVSLGVRQRMTDTLTLLGTAEWTNWSILQSIPYTFITGPIPGQNARTLFFTYRDGWFLSAGAEYKLFADTTLRTGIGYDVSPVNGTLGSVGPTLPGANSTSLSAGVSHKFTDQLTLDFAYSHIWQDSQQIFVGPGNPTQAQLVTLIPGVFNTWAGSAAGHADVVSLAVRYAFADPAASPVTAPLASLGAAPMPVKAPPPAPSTACLWCGFYAGANAGVAWTTTDDAVTATGIPGVAANSERLGGALGGGQIGYDWQWGRVVLGAEADIDASSQSGSNVNALMFPGGGAVPGDIVSTTNKIEDFGTVRARLGLPFDRWMPYVAGGFAWQHVSTTLTAITEAPLPANAIFPIMGNSATLTGWTVGGGVEAALWSRWTVRAEYLYIDTGRLNTTIGPLSATSSLVTSGFAPAGSVISDGTRFTNNVVRVGLSYHFGGLALP